MKVVVVGDTGLLGRETADRGRGQRHEAVAATEDRTVCVVPVQISPVSCGEVAALIAHRCRSVKGVTDGGSVCRRRIRQAGRR